MLGVPSVRVLLDVLIFRQTPAAERGRVVAAVLMLMSLGMPIGSAAAGLLLQLLPAPAVILSLAAALAVGISSCACQRGLWRASWPK